MTASFTPRSEATVGDDSFGPILRSHFDFTLLFQHAIFSLLPAALLILSCPVYIVVKRRQPELIKRNRLYWAKLTLGCFLFLAQIAQLASWTALLDPSSIRKWGVISGSVSSVAALCVIFMLSYEHRHGLRPSALLSAYFALTLILDVIRTRSYFLRSGHDAIGAVQSLVSLCKAILLVMEEIPKSSGVIEESIRHTYGPESFSGLWSEGLCLWVNRVLSTGYKKVLSVDDFANIGPEFDTKKLLNNFENSWKKTNKTRSLPLIKTLIKLHYVDIMAVVPPRILFSVCEFSQPLLFFRALDIMHRTDLPAYDRHGVMIATLFVYGGMIVFRALYIQRNIRLAAFTRGNLFAKIYHKSLLLPTQEAVKGAAITHCTADVEGAIVGVQKIHEWWISFVELGFVMYILYIYVGYACFLLFIPTGLSTAWAAYFSPRAGAAQRSWNDAIQDRVSQTVQILCQARQVKILGLESTMTTYIQGLRVAELKASQRFRALQSVIISMVMIATCFTPVIIIAGALYITKVPLPLEAQRMFATIAVANLAQTPFKNILRVYTEFFSLVNCLGRIQDYLLLEERHDARDASLPSPDVESEFEKGPTVVIADVTAPEIPIRVTDASLSALPTLSPVLQGLNVSIPRSKLTIATGATGSGKSIFLNALLGEANLADGHIFVQGQRMAFSNNKAWVFSGSIRDNIIGRTPYEEKWYQSVLECCCLDVDLANLACGDQTDVSNNGINLSGGQRQRVALARAVYSKPKMLILDDIFSALDHRTSSQVFNGLFKSDGLLRQLNTTVVLATHKIQFLELADVILNFDGNGKISMRAGESKKSLSQTAVDSEKEKPRSKSENTKGIESPSVPPPTGHDKFHKSDRSTWKFFLKSTRRSLVIFFIVGTAIEVVLERLPAAWMRAWVEEYADQRNLFAVFAVFGIMPLFTYLAMAITFFQFLVPQFSESMHKMLIETLFGSTLSYLTSTNHGALINRVSQHMTLVTQQFAMDVFYLPYATFLIVGDIIVVMSSSYYTLVALPPLVIALFLLQRLYLRTSRQIRLLELDAVTPMYTQLGEALSGIEYIRAYGWQQHYLDRSYKEINFLQRPAFHMLSIQRWLQAALDGIGFGLAVVLMSLALYLGDRLPKGGIGMGFTGIMSLNYIAMFFIQQWVAIEASLGAVASLQKFVKETPQEVEWKPDSDADADSDSDPNSIQKPSAPELQMGSIAFDNVTANYKTETSSHVVLHNVSLEVPASTTAGVVGRTGSGKSSLFLALLNLVEYDGLIKINGQDISQVSRKLLRSFITSIPQDCLRVPGTIRQNLMPWLLLEGEKSGKEVQESIVQDTLVRLSLSGRVHAAGGLDAKMTELGLSAGEEQLFSIARSILTRLHTGSRIVLMDEPTSNMDADTDRSVQEVLKTAFAECTVLHITHKEENVADSDAIFEIENGIVKVKKQTDIQGSKEQ